ncbi:MAG: metallophosphoesterase family protein [Syntrophomonas sp.]
MPVFSGYGAENDGFTPYCISVTFNGDVHSCRGFTWYTDEKCAGDLLLMEEAGSKADEFKDARLYRGASCRVERYTGKRGLIKQVSVHRLELTDLKADTTYVYKVGDAERGIWSKPGTFRTASQEGLFRFIIIADSQGEDKEDFLLNAQTLRTAMKTIPDADFLVHMGDFVQNYTDEDSREDFTEWQQFFATAQPELMNTTILPVAGNHDMSRNAFGNHFALDKLVPVGANTEMGAYYAVNYANACFMVLNTNEGYQDGTGRISEQQVEWLKNTAILADKEGIKWKILLMHRGIYSFGRHMDSEDIVELRSQLAPLISDLGIDLVLQGHDHVYMRSQVLAKSAAGNIGPLTEKLKVISRNFAGQNIDFTVNPQGTTYIITNVSGDQFGSRKTSPTVEVYPAAGYKPDDNDEPVFAGISIDGERLVYRAYTYNREGDGQVREIDHYAILKEKNSDIRLEDYSKSLTTAKPAAAISNREIWRFMQGLGPFNGWFQFSR